MDSLFHQCWVYFSFQKNSLGHQCSPVALWRSGGAMTGFTLLWIPGVVLASGNQYKHLNHPWYFRFCLNSSIGSKYQFLLGNGIRCAGAVHSNCVINMGAVIPGKQFPHPVYCLPVQSLRAYILIFTYIAVIVHRVLPSYLPKSEGEILIYSGIKNSWQCDFDRCC